MCVCRDGVFGRHRTNPHYSHLRWAPVNLSSSVSENRLHVHFRTVQFPDPYYSHEKTPRFFPGDFHFVILEGEPPRERAKMIWMGMGIGWLAGALAKTCQCHTVRLERVNHANASFKPPAVWDYHRERARPAYM
jgi:hypothetical protein